MRNSAMRKNSLPIWHLYPIPNGWSTASARLGGPRRCCAISHGTLTASPSRTTAWLHAMTRVSPSSGRMQIDGPERYKVIKLATHEFIRRFLIHVLPAGFIASATMACSPAASVPTTSRAPANCSPSPTSDRCHQTSQYQHQRGANSKASLPLLRRPHDHHRNFSTRQLAQVSQVPVSAGNTSDHHRHLMILFTLMQSESILLRACWPSTASDGARPNAELASQITHSFLLARVISRAPNRSPLHAHADHLALPLGSPPLSCPSPNPHSPRAVCHHPTCSRGFVP